MLKFILSKPFKFVGFFLLLGVNLSYATERRYETPQMLNNYGMPGAIDSPTAEAFPDGQFSFSSSVFGGTVRTNLSFQISDSLTTSFRYSRIPSTGGDHRGYFWDRSFDIHYILKKNTSYFPTIAIGLRDFIGTGLYSGEYLVATTNLNSRLKMSAGLGWGRLSGNNAFSNIFGKGNIRSSAFLGMGGTPSLRQFFSGKNSPFFSASYLLSDRAEFVAEISSDDYDREVLTPKGFERMSDINFGLKYKIAPDFSITAKLMHGNAFGLSGVLALNPKNSPYKSGIEPAPMPLLSDKTLSQTQRLTKASLFDLNSELLELDGIILLELNIIEKDVLEAAILNRNYLDVAQMIGRVARILSKTASKNVRKFRIKLIDYQSSFEIAEIVVPREDLRDNELIFNGPEKLWDKVQFNPSPPRVNQSLYFLKNKFSWSFYPDVDVMLFDPHSPISGSIGWEARSSYRLRNSTTINSSIKQPIFTALDDIKRGPKPGLPNVRSDFMYYHRDIGIRPYISNLTLDQYFKPFNDIYSQLNIGYLEMMYAGIRSETVWKDNGKPYGLGLDLTTVRKRNTFGDFSILNSTYSTIIGTFYYDLPSKWNLKLDAGKYLAGDYGATFSLARTFNNGWEIGGFATLTDVKFSTFGEGSFDKGITLKAPLAWFTGKKSRAFRKTIIRPISGDGGARLILEDDRFLHESIKIYSQKNFKDNWKRVYR